MELCDHGSVMDGKLTQEPLAKKECWRLFRQLVCAVDYRKHAACQPVS
jgi:hypothetical protein